MVKSRIHRKRRGGQSTLDNIVNTTKQTGKSLYDDAAYYSQKVKDAAVAKGNDIKNWYDNLGKPAPAPLYPPYLSNPIRGGKRRHGTRKHKRGGGIVQAYNTYINPFTMNTTPVSGYRTAMPHNWVGGRTRRRRRH